MHTWNEWEIIVNDAKRSKSDTPEVAAILDIDKVLRHLLEHIEYNSMTKRLTGANRHPINDPIAIQKIDAILGEADFLIDLAKSPYKTAEQ